MVHTLAGAAGAWFNRTAVTHPHSWKRFQALDRTRLEYTTMLNRPILLKEADNADNADEGN